MQQLLSSYLRKYKRHIMVTTHTIAQSSFSLFSLAMVKKVHFLQFMLAIAYIEQSKDKLEGYGRITWKRPNTMRGHYFWDLIVAKPVSIHHILRYQMKDMFIIFQMIPHSLILTEWFGHSAFPK